MLALTRASLRSATASGARRNASGAHPDATAAARPYSTAGSNAGGGVG
jgi:hypothetical protein